MSNNLNRTIQNLAEAYLIKSHSAGIYTYYADVARKAGYEILNQMLLHFKQNETEHALIFYQYLSKLISADLEIEADLQSAIEVKVELGNTANNLQTLLELKQNNAKKFQQFSIDASGDDYSDIASTFVNISTVELAQHRVLNNILVEVENNTLYQSETSRQWLCMKCGYIHTSLQAPEICPLCKQARTNFAPYIEMFKEKEDV